MNRFIPVLLALVLLANPMITLHAASLPKKPLTPKAQQEVLNKSLEEFRQLSRKEKKARIREARTLVKEYQKRPDQIMNEEDDQTIILALIAILLPPLAVFLKEDGITDRFWISLLLTLIFWIPGIVYALLVVFEII